MQEQLEIFDKDKIEKVYDRNGLAGRVIEIKNKHVLIMWEYGKFVFALSGIKITDGKYYI